jgi:hypothetical protein
VPPGIHRGALCEQQDRERSATKKKRNKKRKREKKSHLVHSRLRDSLRLSCKICEYNIKLERHLISTPQNLPRKIMSSSHFLASLDVDLLTQIILHLNVTDIVHMMVSSRHFKKLVSRQKLWQTLCGRDFFTEIATNSFDDSPAVVQAVQDERWTDAYKEMTQLVPRFDRVSEFSQRNKSVFVVGWLHWPLMNFA